MKTVSHTIRGGPPVEKLEHVYIETLAKSFVIQALRSGELVITHEIYPQGDATIYTLRKPEVNETPPV